MEVYQTSDELIEPPKTSNDGLAPNLYYIGTNRQVIFTGSCLKLHKLRYLYKKVVNTHIFYELHRWNYNQSNDFVLCNFLFRVVEVTRHVDSDKYCYSEYRIRFNVGSTFCLGNGDLEKL